ncbi:MAG: hypothetical protein WC732_09655 [Candidatus Omnitrophota bacterium]
MSDKLLSMANGAAAAALTQVTAARAVGQSCQGAILSIGTSKVKRTNICVAILAQRPADDGIVDRTVLHVPVYDSKKTVAKTPAPAGQVALPIPAAGDVAVLDEHANVPVYLLRPMLYFPFDPVAPSLLYNTVTFNGLRQSVRAHMPSPNGISGSVPYGMSELLHAYGRHLPHEAWMLPNLRQTPAPACNGVLIRYNPPNCPCSAHMQIGAPVPETAPTGVITVLVPKPYVPAVRTFGGKPDAAAAGADTTSAVEQKMTMNYNGIMQQWSDGSHGGRALSLHPEPTAFKEYVTIACTMWREVTERLIGFRDSVMFNEVAAKWLPLMPLIMVGSVDRGVSPNMADNSPSTIDLPDGMKCAISVMLDTVLFDGETFYSSCLPPVTPEFIKEFCVGKAGASPLLTEKQILTTPSDVKPDFIMTPGDSKRCRVVCESNKAWAEFSRAVIQQVNTAETVAKCQRKLAEAKDDASKSKYADTIKESQPLVVSYHVMVSTIQTTRQDPVAGVVQDYSKVPVFRDMTPEEGTAWVRKMYDDAADKAQFRMLIYSVSGTPTRKLSEFEDHVARIASVHQIAPAGGFDARGGSGAKRPRDEPAAAAAPPATDAPAAPPAAAPDSDEPRPTKQRVVRVVGKPNGK